MASYSNHSPQHWTFLHMNRCLTKFRGLPAAEAAKHLNVSKPSNLIAHPTRGKPQSWGWEFNLFSTVNVENHFGTEASRPNVLTLLCYSYPVAKSNNLKKPLKVQIRKAGMRDMPLSFSTPKIHGLTSSKRASTPPSKSHAYFSESPCVLCNLT